MLKHFDGSLATILFSERSLPTNAKPRLWQVDVLVMPKAGVNDPEGEAIRGGLQSLGYQSVERVRAGKHYRLRLSAPAADDARTSAEEMANKLLANPVIQTFVIESVIESNEAP